MITDVTLAQAACLDIYNPVAVWDQVWTVEGVQCALRVIEGQQILVFEGSHDKSDFERDADALAIHVDGLGWVHRGFYEGLEATLETVLQTAKPDYVCGHSLGGAETYQFALMLANAGYAPKVAVGFEPPRPGFSDFRDKLLATGILLRGYCNRFDPIPDVPTFPFCQPIVLTELCVPADPNDKDPLFRYHHGNLIFQGVSQLLGVQNG